jgi:hypothetical protein
VPDGLRLAGTRRTRDQHLPAERGERNPEHTGELAASVKQRAQVNLGGTACGARRSAP